MTAKETNKELEEILNYKINLINMRSYNVNLLNQIEEYYNKLIRKNGNEEEIKQIKHKINYGKRGISAQSTELNKLTADKIARQLGFKRHQVYHKIAVMRDIRI